MILPRAIAPIAPLATAGLIALAGVTATLASEPVAPEVRTAIEQTLTTEGYTINEIEREDGLYEAETVKDGVAYEVYLDTSGKILKVERDD